MTPPSYPDSDIAWKRVCSTIELQESRPYQPTDAGLTRKVMANQLRPWTTGVDTVAGQSLFATVLR